MTDFSKAQLFSTASSQKVFKEGSGTFSVPVLPGAGEITGGVTIPHGYGSKNLIVQVQASTNIAGTDATVLPWSSNDNRVIEYFRIDSINFVIVCLSSDSSGSGSPARTVTYSYRLLIP